MLFFFDGYKFNLGNHLSNSPVYFINNGGYNFTIKENSFENNSIIEGALNALVFDLDGDGIEEVINISEHYHIDYLPYKPLIEKWLSKKEITKNQRFDNRYNLKPTYYKIINNEFVDMFDKINFSGYDDLFFSMYQSTFGDIDNDGDNDIVFGSQIEKLDSTIGGYVLCILRNDGVGNLNLEVYKNPELNNGIFSTSEGFMLLEDLNDDGYKDLIYNISSPNDAGKIAYLKNDANGKFIYDLNNIIIDLPQGMRNAFALDIEGDGKKEIIIFNSSGYGANGYEGTGPPNIIKVFNVSNFEFEDVTQKYFYNDENELNFYSQMASLRLIDLDGDGEKDLVPKFNLEPPSQGYDYTDNAYFGDWNNSKGFQFFRYDKINNKYQIIDIGEIDRNDIDNGGLKFYYNYNDYDISDLNGDGKPEFYRVKAGEPFNPDLEPKVLNGLMIYEIKGLLLNDSDNDGVTDDIDQCPDTPAGAVLDVNGCEVFTLPVQNFKVEVGSATCVGNSDGVINLSIEDASYDYSVTITGRNDVTIAGDSKTASVTGLPEGTYTVCYKVDGEDNFEQCFEVEVNEPQALSAFMEVNGQNLNITMSGSSQYNIDVNGNTKITSSNNFETLLSSGLNIIKVYTSLKCQGFVEEQILISEEVYYYPNPTQSDVNILVGGKDENVSVSVLTIDGSLIYSREQHVSDITRKTVVDLSKQTSGTYIVVIESETVSQTFKIIKE